MKKHYFWLILASLFISACNQPADDPEVIAKQYWYLIQIGDYAAAEQMVSKDTRSNFQRDIKNLKQIEHVELNNTQTNIRTTVNPSTEHPSLNQPFSTVLILEEGKWKIDALQTQVPPEPGIAEKQRQKMADDFSKSFNKNIESIDEAMRDGLHELNNALRNGSQDMGDSLLKAMQELNESMQESIEKMKQRKENEQPSQPVQPETDNGEGII